jgi:nudix-type nucleoside diphosphatase (YffH/AdpP family)
MRIIESKLLFDGWTKFLSLIVEAPDGHRMQREVLDHGESACVLPYDPDRGLAMMVTQQRVPALYLGHHSPLMEAIAGRLEEQETPAESIRREAEEEAGLKLRDLEHVSTCWASPGVLTERLHLYLSAYSAADRIGPGGGRAEEMEEIHVEEVALSELAKLADRGQLEDAKTLLLVQTLRLRRAALFA